MLFVTQHQLSIIIKHKWAILKKWQNTCTKIPTTPLQQIQKERSKCPQRFYRPVEVLRHAIHDMPSGLYISSSARAFAIGSHNEKPILSKMKQKRFETRNHWNDTFIISSWANICISISEKKLGELKKTGPIFAGLSIEKVTPSTSILAEKGQKMRYFKTVKAIKIARSKEVEAWN